MTTEGRQANPIVRAHLEVDPTPLSPIHALTPLSHDDFSYIRESGWLSSDHFLFTHRFQHPAEPHPSRTDVIRNIRIRSEGVGPPQNELINRMGMVFPDLVEFALQQACDTEELDHVRIEFRGAEADLGPQHDDDKRELHSDFDHILFSDTDSPEQFIPLLQDSRQTRTIHVGVTVNGNGSEHGFGIDHATHGFEYDGTVYQVETQDQYDRAFEHQEPLPIVRKKSRRLLYLPDAYDEDRVPVERIPEGVPHESPFGKSLVKFTTPESLVGVPVNLPGIVIGTMGLRTAA